MAEDRTLLVYDGPAGQSCLEVAHATGSPVVLEPGREYDLPTSLAAALRRSSPHWRAPRNRPAKRATTKE